MPLRTIIYAEEIKKFFSENRPEVWEKLNEPARELITNLSIKLEPFTKVFPKEPETITIGFETLGINGNNGEGFYQVIKRVQEQYCSECQIMANSIGFDLTTPIF